MKDVGVQFHKGIPELDHLNSRLPKKGISGNRGSDVGGTFSLDAQGFHCWHRINKDNV